MNLGLQLQSKVLGHNFSPLVSSSVPWPNCCTKLKCLCVLLCIPNIEEGERGYLTKGNSKAKTIKLEDLPNYFCLGLYLSIPHGRSFKHHPFRL